MPAFGSRTAWMLLLPLLCAGCPSDDPGSGTDNDNDGSSSVSAADSTGIDSTGIDSTGIASTGIADSTDGSTTDGLCVAEHPAIVTDIDETLTLSDGEFLMQLQDASYDPVARDGSVALVNAYADLGYRVLYLTARAESLSAPTGESSRALTEAWLLDHGFPTDPTTTTVVLSDTLVLGNSAQAYKAQALADLQAAGWRFDYAYGNATSDIGAYAEAGIALEQTFIIGEHAGAGGTVAVEGEGWLEHNATFVPTVPAACEG